MALPLLLFVKIAPDIDQALLDDICDVCTKMAHGMICTNTTIERPFVFSNLKTGQGLDSILRFIETEGML